MVMARRMLLGFLDGSNKSQQRCTGGCARVLLIAVDVGGVGLSWLELRDRCHRSGVRIRFTVRSIRTWDLGQFVRTRFLGRLSLGHGADDDLSHCDTFAMLMLPRFLLGEATPFYRMTKECKIQRVTRGLSNGNRPGVCWAGGIKFRRFISQSRDRGPFREFFSPLGGTSGFSTTSILSPL